MISAASIAPLSSYLISICFFGLPHVLYELSYIRKNLLRILPPAFIIIVMTLLLFLVLVRTINLISPTPYVLIIEVFTLISLLLTSLYFRINLTLAAMVFLFCLGLIYNPFILLLCLSFLHNLTPWGFLSLQGKAKNAWIIFLFNPVLVFMLAYFFAVDPHYISATTANTCLSHYLLSPQINVWNSAFFASAVYLQMIHYYFVIKVLPELSLKPIRTNRYQWLFYIVIGFAFIAFFKTGKPIYGIIALFHAYLEIPILFYLLGYKR
ncbi:hypothetical protein [Legionella shakespearei]|uniref:hypothetical protein n=1 Tax=Legionella shakespearei TaxID=45075 RepID=UPI0003823270|nr:hypothetical protein [Legionella shakespearei]